MVRVQNFGVALLQVHGRLQHANSAISEILRPTQMGNAAGTAVRKKIIGTAQDAVQVAVLVPVRKVGQELWAERGGGRGKLGKIAEMTR